MVSMVYYGQEITKIIILFLPGLLTGLDGLLGSRNHEDQHLIPPWTLDRMLEDIAARHPDISWVIVTGAVLYQCNPTCILLFVHHIMSLILLTSSNPTSQCIMSVAQPFSPYLHRPTLIIHMLQLEGTHSDKQNLDIS